MTAKTPTERSAAFKSRGRQIAVVLTDPAACIALDALSATLGSQRAAVEYSLIRCKPKKAR